MNNEQLKTQYTRILGSTNAAFLDSPDRRPGGPKRLSGLFLTSVAPAYAASRNKIMIIGSETAGWEPHKKVPFSSFESLDIYVEKAMQAHERFFRDELDKKRQDRGRTFHNFVRDVAKVVGNEGLVYANLFCFDWRKGSPVKSPYFETIKQLSRQLLHAQVEVLKPQYIIFANGIANARYRREFFPGGAGGRCTAPKRPVETIRPHYLWEFMLDERIRCFRVHHPSARRLEAQEGRAGAIAMLTGAVACKSK